MLADEGLRLAANSTALESDLASDSRLVADAPQIAITMPAALLDEARPDTGEEVGAFDDGASATAQRSQAIPQIPSAPVGTQRAGDSRVAGASLASAPKARQSVTSRSEASPREIPAMASPARDASGPDMSRQRLAAITRRLEGRLEKKEPSRLPSGSRQANLAGAPSMDVKRMPVVSATGERISQDITLQISDDELVSVQLSELISLFEDKLDRPLYVWLKTSANADKFVTPETLTRAGIHLSYNKTSGQAILSIAE